MKFEAQEGSRGQPTPKWVGRDSEHDFLMKFEVQEG